MRNDARLFPAVNRTVRQINRRWAAERLERRRLFDTVLPVFGTSGDDFCTIEMDGNFIYASMNGVMIPQAIGLFFAVEVHFGDGNDILEVRNTVNGVGVGVNPGNGADQVKVTPTTGDLDSLSAGSGVNMHSGTDAVQDSFFIFDDEDAGNDAYDISESVFADARLTKAGEQKAEWDLEHISVGLFLNNGDNTVNLDSTVTMGGAAQNLTITGTEAGGGSGGADVVNFTGTIENNNILRFEGGSGNDTFNVNGDAFTGGSARIQFEGQGEADAVNITDPAATQSYVFNQAGTQIFVTQPAGQGGTYTYTSTESIGINSTHATQAAVYEVNGLGGTTDLAITAGAGDDELVVGDGQISTADFGPDVDITFSGGADADDLFVEDGLSTAAGTHAWNPGGVYDHPSFGTLDVSGVSTATVNLGSGNDSFDVNASAGPGTLIVNGNGGADTFEVTPNIITRIEVNGGGPLGSPGDTLTLSNAPAGGVATISPPSSGSYDYPQRDLIVFTSMESFPLPPLAPGAPDLAAADDTGASNTDNITNDTVLTFSGTGAAANSTVNLLRDGTQIATATATAAGAYTFANLSFPAGDNTFALRAVCISSATGLISGPSGTLSVRVDTVAPVTPGLPDMHAGSDTGISNTDNVTRDPRPVFDGTVPPNDIVRLFGNGVAIGSDTSTAGGSYSIVTSALADGSHIIAARFEDLAGNLSPFSGGVVAIIDTVAPPAPTAAPDLVAASDTGWSDTDNITRDDTPTFTGSAPGNHIVRLLADGNEVAFVQLPIAATTYNLTSPALLNGNRAMTTRFEDIAGNTSGTGPLLGVLVDTVAPTLTNSVFNFLTSHNVRFTFSEDVGGDISVTNFTLRDLTNNVNIPNASLAMSYVPRTATVTFPGFAGGILTDADWQLRVTSGITDIAGNNLGSGGLDFFFLRGDANRDRRVNLADFNVLAANFGQSNRNFSQGDFNYDTVVTLADFNLLAARFGAAVAPGARAGAGASDEFEKDDVLGELVG